MKVKTAIKTAGLSFAGYALASLFADKLPLNAMASQLAGFAGAFLGTLVAPLRDHHRRHSNGNGAQRMGPAKEGGRKPPAAGAAGGTA